MKWKFCQCCFLDGHCENQDRGHRCETYPKQLEDKVERLQEQLNEANKLLIDFCSENECRFDHNGYCQEHDSCEGEYKCIQKDLKQYLKKWGVK